MTEETATGMALRAIRNEIIEQCAKIADPWSGFIDADKMGAQDSAIIEVRQDIAAAIRSLVSTPGESS